jgi:hypothetical protein
MVVTSEIPWHIVRTLMGILVTVGLGEIFEQCVFNDKLAGRLEKISFMWHLVIGIVFWILVERNDLVFNLIKRDGFNTKFNLLCGVIS